MTELDLHPDLQEALVEWLTRVYDDLRPNFAKVLFLLGTESWYSSGEGQLVKYPHRVLLHPGRIDEVVFDQNPFWKRVEELSSQSSLLLKHTGTLLGHKHGARRPYSLRELVRLIFPSPELRAKGQVYLNLENDPATVVRTFLEDLKHTEITETTVWPILGLTTDASIQLEPGVVFRELTSQEKLVLLNFGLIASSYDASFSEEESRWYGLCVESKSPKFHSVNDIPNVDEINSHYQFRNDVLEDFLVAAQLVSDYPVTHAGGQAHAPSITLGGRFSAAISGSGIYNGDMRFRLSPSFHVLSQDSLAEFLCVWEVLRGRVRQKSRLQYGNAARRLYYSSTRLRSGDRLVDLMIAAESLYLNASDKSELKFRLSTNASLWHTDDFELRRKTFALFKRAYDLRSAIVHGNAHKESDALTICEEISPVLRSAVKKFFLILSNGDALPSWEDLLFMPPK